MSKKSKREKVDKDGDIAMSDKSPGFGAMLSETCLSVLGFAKKPVLKVA